MIRIGITGQHGFIGSAIARRVLLQTEEFTLVPFIREEMGDPARFAKWVSTCDAIVHLAGVNRGLDPEALYAANLSLSEQLAEALRAAGNAPHVVFASSIQEERNNAYGRAKREGRQLLAAAASEVGASFTGMLLPNVFGPFGRPRYNSVVSTFCHQLCNGEVPSIEMDAELKLIFVDEVVAAILDSIRSRRHEEEVALAATAVRTVSDILGQLQSYAGDYLRDGKIPRLATLFELNLFNTFRSYIDPVSLFPRALTSHSDARGSFTEMLRTGTGGQVSFSTTHPGITRGNHFHTRKVERFIVIAGKAQIKLRRHRSSEILCFDLDGATPAYVDMPVWYSHNITNIGNTELVTVFWINEAYDASNPDTFIDPV